MRRRYSIPLIVIMTGIAAACDRPSPQSHQQRPVPPAEVAAIGVPSEFLRQINLAGRNLRQLYGINDEGLAYPAKGVTIDVGHKDARGAVNKLQQVSPPGWIAFRSEQNFGIGGQPDAVSVLQADDMFEVIRVMGTNGWNYDISPQMVTERLRRWDRDYGLTLHGAGFDWLEASFQRPPADMRKFAEEVYAFCPDVVDQGTESVEELARQMKQSNVLYLWWD